MHGVTQLSQLAPRRWYRPTRPPSSSTTLHAHSCQANRPPSTPPPFFTWKPPPLPPAKSSTISSFASLYYEPTTTIVLSDSCRQAAEYSGIACCFNSPKARSHHGHRSLVTVESSLPSFGHHILSGNVTLPTSRPLRACRRAAGLSPLFAEQQNSRSTCHRRRVCRYHDFETRGKGREREREIEGGSRGTLVSNDAFWGLKGLIVCGLGSGTRALLRFLDFSRRSYDSACLSFFSLTLFTFRNFFLYHHIYNNLFIK